MIKARLIPALFLLALHATAAWAQGPFETGICPGPLEFGVEPRITLMKVVGNNPRVNLIQNRDQAKPNCPDLSEACKRRGFLVQGDDVLVGEVRNGIACISYISPNAKRVKGRFPETNGFIPAAALAPVGTMAPVAADWIGKWTRDAEAEIEITAGAGGKLLIKGDATFGALDPDRVKRGAVNLGELDAEVMPKGNRIFFGEGYDGVKLPNDAGECQARLHLYGRYLVVEDSSGCGGMNVRFTGFYIRLKGS
jgi:hypothetical protein